MNKRLYPISLLTVLLALVAAGGYLLPETEASQPIRVLLENKGGPVIFEHEGHAAGYGIDCVDCHHETDSPEDGVTPCGECHNADTAGEDMPGRMDAFHLQCMGCHEELMAGPYGQEDCTKCHFK